MTTFVDDEMRFGTGVVSGTKYAGGTFCISCGWFIAGLDRDYTGDTSCDACGADLTFNSDIPKVYASAGAAAKAGAGAAKGGTGVPGGPAAAPAPPVETPDASWSKDDIHDYLDARGITYDGRWSVTKLLELV
jgi:hypothetical protein